MVYKMLTHIGSQFKGLASSMIESYKAETREQIPLSSTETILAKTRALHPRSMMDRYLAESQDQRLWRATVYRSRPDTEPQFKGLASPMAQSYAAETQEQTPRSSTDSILAEARVQQPRSMMERDLAGSEGQQSWKIALPQYLHGVSCLDRYEEEQHKQSPKESLSLEQDNKTSLQIASTDISSEPLILRDEDTDNLLLSPSLSSLIPYAGKWSNFDQLLAGLILTAKLPDSRAEVSPNTNVLTKSQTIDVVRLHQDETVLFAILSRRAYPRDASRMTNHSPAPTDAAPTNQTSANGKARGSSRKRSNQSKQNPKSSNNNKEVDGESDSDGHHRRIRQKTTRVPLKEVEQRAFACPFYKLYPQSYQRMCGEIRYPPTSSGVYSLQRHIFDKHGPFGLAIHESVAALPRLRPTERWRELCKTCARIEDALVPDDPYWYPPRNNDINENIADYMLEARRLSYELDQELERSRQEAERRENALVAEAREQARNEKHARDGQIKTSHAAKFQQLGARFQPALPSCLNSDQLIVTSSIPELPGRLDNDSGLRVAAEESGSSESYGISEQVQQQILVDPSLSLLATTSEGISRCGLIGGNTISDPPAAVVGPVTPSLAASGSEEPRNGSSAPSTPANTASLSRTVQIATSSPSSPDDPNVEKIGYGCNCGVPTVEGELCCEDCRLWDGNIAR